MSTLNHEVYANPTTPLWLSAQGGNIQATVNVVDNLVAPTTQTTVYDTGSNGGIYFHDYGGSPTTRYGELMFDKTPEVLILVNAQPKIIATTSNTYFTTPIEVVNQQVGQATEITTNGIRNPTGTPDAEITFGQDWVNLGTEAYVGNHGDGLVVYTPGYANYSQLRSQSVTFSTTTTSPVTSVENFATAVLPLQGWVSRTNMPFNGFIWSSDNPSGDANGGITYTDPALSTKAVTTSGQPTSGKGAWLAGLPQSAGGQYNSYLEFPPITAQQGTIVSVTWKHVGSVFGIALYKNEQIAIGNSPTFVPNATAWSTPIDLPYQFVSSGTDYLYLQVASVTGVPYTYTTYNISDISITTQGLLYNQEGGMALAGANAVRIGSADPATAPTYVLVTATGVNATANDGVNQSQLILAGPSATLLSSSNVFLTAGSNIIANAPLNMTNNNIDFVTSLTSTGATITNLYTANVYVKAGFSNISVYTPIDMVSNTISNVATLISANISNASNVTTSNVITDTVNSTSTYLTIGATTNAVKLSNTTEIDGKTGVGSILNNFISANGGAPLTQGFQLQYVTNISGFRFATAYIPPCAIASISNDVMFGSGFSGTDYVQTTAYVLPPRSELRVLSGGSVIEVKTNISAVPTRFPSTVFSPSSSSQSYTLLPIIT
jgi:hypothetical protein